MAGGWKMDDLHGGSGTVTVYQLLGEDALPPFSAALWCELAPGASVGTHTQQRDPELLIGLSGAGEVELDGVARPLMAGATVPVPFGSTLALRNPGQQPLVYLIIKARDEGPGRS